MNHLVMKLDDAHPAKKFLSAFIDCKANCVGRHHGLDGRRPIDQEWTSPSDGTRWTFSGFAYAFLSLDIDVDSFLVSAPSQTEQSTTNTWNLPLLRSLMNECEQAARQSGNAEIVELTDQVQRTFNLWEHFLGSREGMNSRARD